MNLGEQEEEDWALIFFSRKMATLNTFGSPAFHLLPTGNIRSRGTQVVK